MQTKKKRGIMDKSLKKLNRRQLLELLLEASQMNEALVAENTKLKQSLSSQPRIPKSVKVGSIAEAALQANGYFDSAQRAADDYLREIKRLRDHLATKATLQQRDPRVQSTQPQQLPLVQADAQAAQQAEREAVQRAQAAQQAEREAVQRAQAAQRAEREAAQKAQAHLDEARARAEKMLAQANAQAQSVVNEAQTRADAIIADANRQSHAIISEANRRADSVIEATNKVVGRGQTGPLASHGRHVRADNSSRQR